MKARVFLLICRSVEMSSCLSNIAFKRGISTSSCLFRYATTNPEGRWIKDKTKKNTVLPWMITHKKGMEKARHDYNRIKDFDYMTSDVEQAKLSAITELEKLGKKIEDRGDARECWPYSPPDDVERQIKLIAQEVLEVDEKDEDWSELSIDDLFTKYLFLNECAKKLDHEVPSPLLHEMKHIRDVVVFYLTPVRGISKLDDMVRKQDQLPPNLCVMPNYRMVDPTKDEFFKGCDAYPKMPLKIVGAKGKKKYPSFKERMEWPDI